MSEAQNTAPQLSLLEQFKFQHAQFVAQRDYSQTNLNQLIGAIHASEVMIKKYEEEEAKKQNLGDQGNGQVDDQKPE